MEESILQFMEACHAPRFLPDSLIPSRTFIICILRDVPRRISVRFRWQPKALVRERTNSNEEDLLAPVRLGLPEQRAC
jgi:hypothetical protein